VKQLRTRALPSGGNGGSRNRKRFELRFTTERNQKESIMTLQRITPFADFDRSFNRELNTMRRTIDRLFDDRVFGREALLEPFEFDFAGFPLDIYEEGENLVVKASIPGLKPEDLKVEVRDDILTITGETKEDKEEKERNYHLREHRATRYERSVMLPNAVKIDKAEAVFENGKLILTLPRSGEVKAKSIPVKASKS
jgi:HSP20 family protein